MGHERFTPAAGPAGQASGARHREGGVRHAAKDLARAAAGARQAQGVRRRRASACGAAAQAVCRHSVEVEGERMTAAPEFRWQAVGRRKTSVARVYLTPGTGKWDINGRTLGDYFPRPSLVSAHPAAVHRDRHARRVRREGACGRRRAGRPGGRDAARASPARWSRPMGGIGPSCGRPGC